MRNDFVYSRLGRKGSRSELKDLTDFMHGFPAPLVECRQCGVMTRWEQRVRTADAYEDDPNDTDLMTQVYPRYLEAFRKKREAYQGRLRPHAEVLEIGSHLGAFLQTAEEWNWRPAGLDVGKDTSEFVRSKGLVVYRETIEESRFGSETFDGVFVWNCFEQLPDPGPVLGAIHGKLKRHGLLTIRVPNVLFYRILSRGAQEDGFAMRALAYNNLLGFPYLYGYTMESLNRLVTRWGFEPVRGFNSELVTMPFGDVSRRIFEEQMAISEAVRRLMGPWMELVYRKVEMPWRGTKCKMDARFLERAS